jgi:hypothetical protein
MSASWVGSTLQLAFCGSMSCALARLFLGEQLRHRDAPETRVADIAKHVGVSELLRLDHRMQRLRRVESPLAQRKALEDVQHLQRGDALSVGRQLGHRPAAVAGLDRLDPFGLELRKIVERHGAALLAHDVHDRLRGGAPVVAVATLFGDAAERSRQVRVLEDLARAGWALAIDEVRRAGVGLLGEELQRLGPVVGGDLHDREAVLGVPDSGR